ncbi:low-density lipoprotein receptor isoform X2 [Ischnura elegans]|uniref:low-density lipoprotein receptor isoform X2 n=1 Tax=Ischnura elegans TaxID=197161 RepID=UPI001ED8B751|nr:low-density lipoprotein receptor isoform X2 [Ischnura elegans]
MAVRRWCFSGPSMRPWWALSAALFLAFISSQALAMETVCSLRQFQCGNGRCIPIAWTCDGEDDCGDKTDETGPDCSESRTCSGTEFRCNNGRCIPEHWQCDNEKDCGDGSDEDKDTCRKHPCLESQFRCPDDVCIPTAWKCDGAVDCPGAQDEAGCDYETCRSDEFTCANGKCVQLRWYCDRDDDCGDGSDEANCTATTCSPDAEFACSNSYCITKRWQCDGDQDCPDGSDEKNCTTRSTPVSHCNAREFECRDRVNCIHRSWVCDGDRDCPDGSDEEAELCHNVTCRPDQFRCASGAAGDGSIGGVCIPGHLHCSGTVECPDGSDEENCTSPTPPCDPKTEFDCGGGMCIPATKACDGKPDCPNWEDEPRGRCLTNECKGETYEGGPPGLPNGGCSQTCVDTPTDYYCDCLTGYHLVDNRTCDDIDECDTPGSCSQICINEKGSFKCECTKGYLRDPRDHTRCKATEGHASLLFTRRHDIRKVSLDHHEMTAIVNDTKAATAIDFVFRTGMIFWSDISDQKIYKAPIDEGREHSVVIRDEVTTADGLAVDWIYNHIYWTDTGRNTIVLANFEGSMRKVLIQDKVQQPRAIALNPLKGWMYWTDWGAEPKIERAGMDGTHRQVIVDFDVKWPNGLTLDLVAERIYWVDAKLNTLSSANYDGSGRRVILYSPDDLKHPFSITTFEDWVYWTDWHKQTIFKANKFTGKDLAPVTAVHMLEHPMVVHVYHPYRQPDGDNYCQMVNGHCSHLCLPAPQINNRSPKISCACPDGLRFLPDGLTCVDEANSSAGNFSGVLTGMLPGLKSIPSDDDDGDYDESTTVIHTSLYPNNPTRRPGSGKSGGGTDGPAIYAPDDADSGMVAGITIGIVLSVILVVGLMAFAAYRHFLHRNVTSMNFDNPVYRKTTEDQFSLEKNQLHPTRIYPSTVGEEAQEPLNSPGTNEYV